MDKHQEGKNLCLLCPYPVADASYRLFCIPYAGGGPQIFSHWAEMLSPFLEVCAINLPGRGRRFSEPAHESMSGLVAELAESLPLDKRFAIFGHSMGALVGYELAKECARRGNVPLHLFASGCFAPHLPDPHPIHHLPNEEFLSEFRKIGGPASEVRDTSELLDLLLPMIRADFVLTETYVPSPGPPLCCPITAFAGEEDQMASISSVQSWRAHTTGTFDIHLLEGDHLFLHQAERKIVSVVASAIRTQHEANFAEQIS
jgi:medium-chain acyl-[acyl-carrier-protein] hydrolase